MNLSTLKLQIWFLIMHINKAMSAALFGRAVVTPKASGIIKSDVDVSVFTPTDFLRYWKDKAKQRDIKYVTVQYKDNAILKSVMKSYTNTEIKLMIDYLWDSGERISSNDKEIPYTDYGIYLLSSGWANSIYNRANFWKKHFKDKELRGCENTRGENVAEMEF